jgi:hypothetical protein
MAILMKDHKTATSSLMNVLLSFSNQFGFGGIPDDDQGDDIIDDDEETHMDEDGPHDL